jgi:hypothetical protein
MLKSKKFWCYEVAQVFDLKQESLEAFKLKGRIYDDFIFFFETLGIGVHPNLKQPYGKEHLEPNSFSFISTLVDITTLKILFTCLPASKVVLLKFCSNNFEVMNLEYLVNSLLTKPNNIYNFVFEWNGKIKIENELHDLNLSHSETQNLLKIQDNHDQKTPHHEKNESHSKHDTHSNFNQEAHHLNVENFSNLNMNNHTIQEIIKAGQILSKLTTSTRLEALCLRGNFLGDDNAILLFENLKTNNTLKTLNLYKNNLTSKCMSTFNSMIEVNRKLEEINLGANFFVDEDLATFRNFIGKNQLTNEQYENHSKKLKDKEAIIEKNKKLKAQKKPEEPLPFLEEVTQIGDAFFIVKNCHLKNLNIMQNSFTEKCYETIISILEANNDILLTMDGKIFSKGLKDKLIDPFGKYGSRVYLTK